MERPLKRVEWMGSSLLDLRDSPADARTTLGRDLQRVQRGEEPKDFKPMPAVGPGVLEIRFHSSVEYRLIYIAKFAEAIYVLHVFEKRTRKTSPRDIELARRRLAQVVRQRQAKR